MGVAAKLDALVLRSPFDARTLPVYSALAAKLAFGVAAAILAGFTFSLNFTSTLAIWGPIIAAGMALRRMGLVRAGGFMEAFAILYGQGFLAIATLAVGASFNRPYTDELLASWDAALGFDWQAFIDLCRPYARSLGVIYNSFLWQGWVILAVLFWKRQETRAWIFVTSATLTLIACDLIFPFFPANAAFLHYGVNEYEGHGVPFSFLEKLEYIRHGGRDLTRGLISGFVTFPSYHAASGLLFIWASWRTALRWPFLVLNLLLIASCIPIGGHYLVDLIAGMTIAAITIWASAALIRQTGPNTSLPYPSPKNS